MVEHHKSKLTKPLPNPSPGADGTCRKKQEKGKLTFDEPLTLQEGYEPFCVNMTRNVTFWYTKSLPIFENNEDLANSKIDVTRLPAGADNPPSLKISHNTYEQEEKADWEFLRLSLPVTCKISSHLT